MADALRVALGLALTLFLPGFALAALFWPWRPSGPWEWARRLLLGVVLSVALVVVVSVPLVYGPWSLGGRGLFQGGATGAPVLELVLGALSLLFALGWGVRRTYRSPFPGRDPEEEQQHRRAEQLARGEGSEEDADRDLYG
jgi:uncharacterized membrane protein